LSEKGKKTNSKKCLTPSVEEEVSQIGVENPLKGIDNTLHTMKESFFKTEFMTDDVNASNRISGLRDVT
jgi:hypothetical protein